jgi:hypothetical protein
VIRVQILVDPPYDGPERVLYPIAGVRLPAVVSFQLFMTEDVQHERQDALTRRMSRYV